MPRNPGEFKNAGDDALAQPGIIPSGPPAAAGWAKPGTPVAAIDYGAIIAALFRSPVP
jgi:hypothetical protein